MESILFRWNPLNKDQAQWVTIDSEGRPHAATRCGSVAQLAQQLNSGQANRKAVWLVPAELIGLHIAELPPKQSGSHVKQATPYALEDELIDDLEDLHFAFGDAEKTDSATRIPVAVIHKDLLTNALAKLADANIRPRTAIPEILLIPTYGDNYSIVLDNDTAYLRLNQHQAYSLDKTHLENTFNNLVTNTINGVQIWQTSDQPLPQLGEYPVSNHGHNHEFITLLAKQYKASKSFNLLQGEFRYREQYGQYIKPWRWAAMLAGIALLLNILGNGLQIYQLSQHNQQLIDEKVAIYKQTFPSSRNVPKPRFQMEQALKKLGAQTDVTPSELLPMMQLVSSSLQNQQAMNISSIAFAKQRLDIQLTAPDLQILDKLKAELDSNKRYQAKIVSANSEQNSVEAQIRLEIL